MTIIIFGATSIGILFGIINLVLIPYLSLKFGTPSIPGQLLSIGMISAIFLAPLFGTISDKTRKRMPFILFFAIASALGVTGLISPSLLFLGISAVLIVASTYTYSTLYSALVSDYSTIKSKDSNFGFIMGTINISTFLTSLLIAFIYNKRLQLTFLVLGSLIILPIIPVMIYTQKHPPFFAMHETIKKTTGIFDFLKIHPEFVIYLFIQFCIWFSLGGLLPYLTSFLTELGMNVGIASAWVGASTFLSGLISFTTGYFSKLMGRKKLLMLSLIAITALFGIVAFFYQIVLSDCWLRIFEMSFFAIFSISTGFFYSLNASTLSLLVSESEQGRAFGINGVIMMVSESLSISLMGSVINHSGYKEMCILIFIGSGLALIGFLYLLHFIREKHEFRVSKGTYKM